MFFVKDLADEGFSMIIGNCRNIFKKFLPLNMFFLPSNFPKIASVVQKSSPAFTEINNTIQNSEFLFSKFKPYFGHDSFVKASSLF